MPKIQVEFFGVPRLKAGMAQIHVEAETIADVLRGLAIELPEFACSCLQEGALASEYLLCINGTQFTRDATLRLHPGDTVLILSADVGGT